MKSKYEYLPADKYVVINDNDIDLRPIVLRLPEPPPLHLIDGYGLPPEDQRFKRLEIPRRLIDLEAEAVVKTKEELSTNKNNVVTLLKIQKNFWDLLYSRHKEMKKEIDFIRRVWWHRLKGFWFMNKGKPTYISGWHFYYLNFWTMNTKDGTNRPSYRDRDRKEFIFKLYCFTTTETFARLDDQGFAIKEEDGSYKMRDMGQRVCFGEMQPKNRRSGNTNKGLSSGIEYVTRIERSHGMGIQSFSNQNAKETFDGLLMPAYEQIPIWLKPNTVSGRTSDSLKFNVGKNEYGEPALQTQVTYATTASEKFYDSKKMHFLQVEEPGKTDEVDIAERHEVNRHTLSQAGMQIHGYTTYPSTVSETSEGAGYYRAMSDTSIFYQRIPATGQTKSGIFRIFVPATEGLDGFIDSYGYSVKDKIEDYQRKEGFTRTAEEVLVSKRDTLLNDGKPESLRLYRMEKKLFPITYSDCWLGESGDIGFNIVNIDSQLAELRRFSNMIRGDLKWVNNAYGTDVYFEPNEESGLWYMSRRPPENITNKKVIISAYSMWEGGYVNQYRPMYPGMFTIGADPFEASKGADTKRARLSGQSGKLSDGGIACLWNFDESIDKGKNISDWDSYTFVLSFRNRMPTTDDYDEEVLKAAIFFGAMVYPETNVSHTYEYFIRNKFGGYLLYDIDKYTGKIKDKPGMDSLERSKKDLFDLWRDYVELRCHKEQHANILTEVKNIKRPEDMRYNDLFAAGGLALMGAKSRYPEMINITENKDYDLQDFLWT